MTHVSKISLEPGQLDELFNELCVQVGTLTTSEINLFLSDLLGTEERIMIAKRLAAIVMLVQNQSLYKISETLLLSSSTVNIIKTKLEAGQYEHIVRHFQKNQNGFMKLLETLDAILHLGGILPHYSGIDRYKYIK